MTNYELVHHCMTTIISIESTENDAHAPVVTIRHWQRSTAIIPRTSSRKEADAAAAYACCNWARLNQAHEFVSLLLAQQRCGTWRLASEQSVDTDSLVPLKPTVH